MKRSISIWDVLHYGAAAILFIFATAHNLGFDLPGIEVNPVTAYTAAMGILGAGLKSTPLSGEKK